MKNQIDKIENTINGWICSLINKEELPKHLLSERFIMEDGMSLEEYWQYEKNSFDSYSKIFDLNNNFKINIINIQKLDINKDLIWFYVINYKNKVVFKMSITIYENKIASNNFYTQIVTKYKLKNKVINGLGLAIKSAKKIETIISPELELISFSEGSNFKEDSFYSATYNSENLTFNKTYLFFIKFSDGSTEKRYVFFDNLRLSDCPYYIDNNMLKLDNDKYPVNLAIFYKDGKNSNYEYPRNIKESLSGIVRIIATDVLDNDWEELFK